MIAARPEPSCGSPPRWATGVLGSKNATQLALIWATVAVLPPLAEGAAVTGAGDETGVEGVAGAPAFPLGLALAPALDPDGEPPPPLQAATATAGSRANPATEISRTDWSRI